MVEREVRGTADREGAAEEEDEGEDTGNRGLLVSVDRQRSLATLASHARFSVCWLSGAAVAVAATTTGRCSSASISRFLGVFLSVVFLPFLSAPCRYRRVLTGGTRRGDLP